MTREKKRGKNKLREFDNLQTLFFLHSQITPTRSWLFYRNSINCTLLAYARDTVWIVEFANPMTIKKGSGGGSGVGRLGYMSSVCENWFRWRCARGYDVYTLNKARKVEVRFARICCSLGVSIPRLSVVCSYNLTGFRWGKTFVEGSKLNWFIFINFERDLVWALSCFPSSRPPFISAK